MKNTRGKREGGRQTPSQTSANVTNYARFLRGMIIALADKNGVDIASTRHDGRGGKPRATAPGGNPANGAAQNTAIAEKKCPNRSARKEGL